MHCRANYELPLLTRDATDEHEGTSSYQARAASASDYRHWTRSSRDDYSPGYDTMLSPVTGAPSYQATMQFLPSSKLSHHYKLR
jgi:hypothetical protein